MPVQIPGTAKQVVASDEQNEKAVATYCGNNTIVDDAGLAADVDAAFLTGTAGAQALPLKARRMLADMIKNQFQIRDRT